MQKYCQFGIAQDPTSYAQAQYNHAGFNILRMRQSQRQVQHPALCIVIDAVVLTSNVSDQAAIAMAFLREEIALRRAQIDAEKKAAALQKATNDALREENRQYDEHQEQLRQELAELDTELSAAHAVTVAEQQKGSALLEVRKDWDPEYLARLAPTTAAWCWKWLGRFLRQSSRFVWIQHRRLVVQYHYRSLWRIWYHEVGCWDLW
jgi:hypothetical protein